MFCKIENEDSKSRSYSWLNLKIYVIYFLYILLANKQTSKVKIYLCPQRQIWGSFFSVIFFKSLFSMAINQISLVPRHDRGDLWRKGSKLTESSFWAKRRAKRREIKTETERDREKTERRARNSFLWARESGRERERAEERERENTKKRWRKTERVTGKSR